MLLLSNRTDKAGRNKQIHKQTNKQNRDLEIKRKSPRQGGSGKAVEFVP